MHRNYCPSCTAMTPHSRDDRDDAAIDTCSKCGHQTTRPKATDSLVSPTPNIVVIDSSSKLVPEEKIALEEYVVALLKAGFQLDDLELRFVENSPTAYKELWWTGDVPPKCICSSEIIPSSAAQRTQRAQEQGIDAGTQRGDTFSLSVRAYPEEPKLR